MLELSLAEWQSCAAPRVEISPPQIGAMTPRIGFRQLSGQIWDTGIRPSIPDLIFSQFGWLTTSDMEMARYGDGCRSGYEEVGQSTSGPAPSLFHPCLTQPKQYAADVMKSMMYFDPPLHILTSIHLHILPCPYLIDPVIII